MTTSGSALGLELSADTAAGAGMVTAATRFATEFADGAMAHDREGTFAIEHLDKLRADRFLVAPIPTELGGGGVISMHDVFVACSRLARGDPATTIGVNMHFAGVLNTVRAWRAACTRREHAKVATIGDGLRRIVEHDIVFAAAVSEPSPQDLTRPSTTATRTDDGWVVNGIKAFATMGPAATILNVAVTYRDPSGGERYGFVMVPAGAPGVVFNDDWDALGMRASASGSVSFRDVLVTVGALRDGFTAGTYSAAMLGRYLAAGAFHAAASLGIAEAAHATIVTTLRARRESVVSDAHAVTELGANLTDLAAMRASFERAARLIDEHVEANLTGEAPMEEIQPVYAEVQAAKAFLTEAAVRVVDRALALSGGAGYMASHPLAKAWRDVRAGGFMHPVGQNRSAGLLARTALGLAPEDSRP